MPPGKCHIMVGNVNAEVMLLIGQQHFLRRWSCLSRHQGNCITCLYRCMELRIMSTLHVHVKVNMYCWLFCYFHCSAHCTWFYRTFRIQDQRARLGVLAPFAAHDKLFLVLSQYPLPCTVQEYNDLNWIWISVKFQWQFPFKKMLLKNSFAKWCHPV